MNLRAFWHRLLRLFTRRQTRLALYGPPNGGKTTLANRICADWLGEEMGSTSRIAHETRRVQLKQGVKVVYEDGRTLSFSLVDTPGISSRVDAADFVREGLGQEEAKARAKEAAQGVVESIAWIGNADCVVVVLDATKEPRNQVNATLIESLAQRKVPFFIVANKVDLRKANVAKVEGAFSPHEVLGISAKYGDHIDLFYEKLFELAQRSGR